MAMGNGRIGGMDKINPVVRPVTNRDLLAITRMTFKNMSGVDRHFTRITRNPIRRLTEFLKMPIYLAFSGQGFKIVAGSCKRNRRVFIIICPHSFTDEKSNNKHDAKIHQ